MNKPVFQSNISGLQEPSTDAAAWIPKEMQANCDWLHYLSDSELEEVHEAVEHVTLHGLDFLDIDRDAFPLPEFSERLAKIRHELLYGRGFVLFRGLDIDTKDRRRAALAFWGISMHLGDSALSQNANGHALGHVYDLGQTKSNALQRGPYSRESIPYHCDWCDITGLYCVNPAKQGGENSIVSAVTVYNEILNCRPDFLEALSQPIYRDRRGEVPTGMDEWYALPVFNVYKGWFAANIEPTYIGSAERFPDVPRKTQLQRDAISEVQRKCEERYLAMNFLPGDIQFVNNHTTFHSRSGYKDHAETSRKRHLLRIWLKCLDGRPLSPWFYARNGLHGTVDRPGGIVGADTELKTPLEPEIHR